MSTPAAHTQATPRLRVGQWLAVTIGVLLAFAITGVGLALLANHRLSDQRHVVLDEVEPALVAAFNLESALVDEETGVRGYIISGRPVSLAPYVEGRAAENRAYRDLEAQALVGASALAADLRSVRAKADAWQRRFAAPILEQARHARAPVARNLAGKTEFDAIRVPLSRLRADLALRLASARRKLASDANFLQVVLLVAAGLIMGSVLAAGFLLRRIITRPLADLGRDAGEVAAGDFGKPVVAAGGAREIVELGDEIDGMRRRIVRELATVESARSALEAQTHELNRSNAELEQFAYVASHDLQEPLRKIASFCQALERRYHGQLDERADQYIDFAVDGAKRMQTLINDLLAFSRVGRSGRELQPVDLNDILAQAKLSLGGSLEENDAIVSVEQVLPVVRGDPTLLLSLFQNLIGNAIKFRGSEPPVVRLSARQTGEEWELSCSDNGIGIDAEYSARIFVVFQRLHTKEAYPGTGIGLAMCRKIVEYHGGRIWLDADHARGAEFRFTLPIAKENAHDGRADLGTAR